MTIATEYLLPAEFRSRIVAAADAKDPNQLVRVLQEIWGKRHPDILKIDPRRYYLPVGSALRLYRLAPQTYQALVMESLGPPTSAGFWSRLARVACDAFRLGDWSLLGWLAFQADAALAVPPLPESGVKTRRLGEAADTMSDLDSAHSLPEVPESPRAGAKTATPMCDIVGSAVLDAFEKAFSLPSGAMPMSCYVNCALGYFWALPKSFVLPPELLGYQRPSVRLPQAEKKDGETCGANPPPDLSEQHWRLLDLFWTKNRGVWRLYPNVFAEMATFDNPFLPRFVEELERCQDQPPEVPEGQPILTNTFARLLFPSEPAARVVTPAIVPKTAEAPHVRLPGKPQGGFALTAPPHLAQPPKRKAGLVGSFFRAAAAIGRLPWRRSPSGQHPRTPIMSVLIVLIGCLLGAVVVADDPPQPPTFIHEQPDTIVEFKVDQKGEDRAKRSLSGKIISVDDESIQFRIGQRLPETFSKKTYKIQRWDGIVNARALVEQAKRYDERIEACVRDTETKAASGSDIEQTIKRALGDAGRASQMLKRITEKGQAAQENAAQELAEAQRLLPKLSEPAIRARFQKAHLLYEAARRISVLGGPLGESLAAGQWGHVLVNCQEIEQGLDKISRDVEADAVEVIERTRGILMRLRTIAGRLKTLPAQSNIDDLDLSGLAAALADCEKAVEESKSVGDMAVLGEGLNELWQKQATATELLRGQLAKYANASGGLPKMEARLKEWRATAFQQPSPDPNGITAEWLVGFKRDLDRLRAAWPKLGGLPEQRYAQRQTEKLWEAAQAERWDVCLALHASGIAKERDNLTTLRSSADATALHAVLAKRFHDLEKLGGGENVSEKQQTLRKQLLASAGANLDESVCVGTGLRLAGMESQLATLFNWQSIGEATQRTEPLAEWLKELDGMEESLKTVAQRSPEKTSRTAALLVRLRPVRSSAGALNELVEVHRHLARVPAKIDSREELLQGQASAKKATETLDALPATKLAGQFLADELQKARSRTAATLERVRQRLGDAIPVVRGLELRSDLESHRRSGESAMAAKKLRQAQFVLINAAAALDELDRLTQTQVPAKEDSRIVGALREHSAWQAAFQEKVESALREARRAAGWLRLPNAAGSLVPATPESALLRIDFLVGVARLDEAERELAAFTAAHPDNASAAHAAELRTRLDFSRAAGNEDRYFLAPTPHGLEDLRTAYQTYQYLADTKSGHPLVAASRFAIARLDNHFRELESERLRLLRLATLVMVATVGIGMFGALLWGDRLQVRLSRAARQLAAAEACEKRRDSARRDEHLRRLAQLLPGLPADHPGVIRLRSQIERPTAVLTPQATCRASCDPPDLQEVVDGLIRSKHASCEAAHVCLDWLAASREAEGSPRREAALQWLRGRLLPDESMSPDELQRHLQLARRCHEVFPAAQWPLLFELSALWWLHQIKESAEVALRVDLNRIADSPSPQLSLVLGVALFRAGRLREAIGVFKQLRRDAACRDRAARWHRVAVATALGRQVLSHPARVICGLLKN